jgi:Protein of unknown function (DUF1194)
MFVAILAGFAMASVSAPAPAAAPLQSVDLELVLATDNSQSIDESEARLQRDGIAAAFRSPDVIRAIQSGSLGRIAVAYLDWSSGPYTRISVNWRLIHDGASAQAFSAALLAAPPAYGSGTAIGDAIDLAARMIETNAFDGAKRTIDVSGDGPYNRGRPVSMARDEVAAKGITINGLPIITGDYGNGDWGIYYGKIDEYYANCVIGGPGSFALPVHGFQDFATAIRRKLVLEISDAVRARKQPAIILIAAERGLTVPLRPLARDPAIAEKNCNSYYGGLRLRGR